MEVDDGSEAGAAAVVFFFSPFLNRVWDESLGNIFTSLTRNEVSNSFRVSEVKEELASSFLFSSILFAKAIADIKFPVREKSNIICKITTPSH